MTPSRDPRRPPSKGRDIAGRLLAGVLAVAAVAGCGEPSPGETTPTVVASGGLDPSVPRSTGLAKRGGRARIPTGGRLEREKMRSQGENPR
ncbi:MAG: hypothetical protein ACLQGP_26370 [Isosphaeraceae bacterium]